MTEDPFFWAMLKWWFVFSTIAAVLDYIQYDKWYWLVAVAWMGFCVHYAIKRQHECRDKRNKAQ